MISLALSCAAALALAGLPDDAPTAADPPADAATAATNPSSPTEPPGPRPALRPARMLYRGGPIPSEYELVSEYDTSLLLGGMASLIVGYTGATIFALVAGFHSLVVIQRADPFLALLPLVGPLLALGGPGYRSQVHPDLLYLRDVVCLGDAVVQWLGAVLASVGYFFPTKVLLLKEGSGGGVGAGAGARAGMLLPLGPGGGPGVSWSVAFGP